MKRKDFIKSSAALTCLFCAGATSTLLESCSPKALPALTLEKNQDTFALPITAWDGGDVVMVARKGAPSILIHKNGEKYTALPMKCTHQGARLKWENNTLVCGLHGSIFQTDGSVTKGPAKQALIPFQVQTKDGIVNVTLQAKS